MNQAEYSCAPNPQNTIHSESSDDQMKLERILRIVAHGFEADAEMNRLRLQPFAKCFCNCSNVLDVGCGEGLMLELLRDAGTTAIGVDTDPNKVARARSKGLEAITVDAHEYLHDKKGGFDGIFLSHIIEHFDGPDAVRLLYLCRRALQPNGMIIVITPNYMSSDIAMQGFWLDITHRRPYPMLLLQHIFATLGIAVVECGVGHMGQEIIIAGKVTK